MRYKFEVEVQIYHPSSDEIIEVLDTDIYQWLKQAMRENLRMPKDAVPIVSVKTKPY